MDRHAKIFVIGHSGMVGKAVLRQLHVAGYDNLLLRTHAELDLQDQRAVGDFLTEQGPLYTFIAAANVGGNQANDQYCADFLYQNLVIETSLIHGTLLAGVQKLMFLGSSCIYPRDCAQPIKEEYLLAGPLEATNEPYAIAKIAGVELSESYQRQYGRQYISVMPTSLYGPNDIYDLSSSHVRPALLRKAHEAKIRGDAEYIDSGTGTPRREYLYVDNLTDACVFLMERDHEGGLLNLGTGQDVTIRELAETVMEVVGLSGRIVYDSSKPDGTPRKLLDISRLSALGWRAHTTLREGIQRGYVAAPFRT